MERGFEKMFQLSFTTLATPELEGLEVIEAASMYKYDGIDLRVSDHKGELTIDSSRDYMDIIRSMADSKGITISSLLCYNKTGGKDRKSWINMRDSVLKHMEIALQIGAKAIRMDVERPINGKFDDYSENFMEVMGYILERNSSDIYIRIQNHRNGLTVSECLSLIKKVNSSRFGLIYSPEHCITTGENIYSHVDDIRMYTQQVYIADIIKKGNEYKDILPGKGLLNMRREMDIIGGDSFKGFISFKWEKLWDNELKDYTVALPLFRDYILNAI